MANQGRRDLDGATRIGPCESQLAPPWLEPLLETPFFLTCAEHGDAPRAECNMFCLDCPGAAAFCFYCRAIDHSDHRTIQGALDITGVQTYVINSARVVFLNERPLSKGTAASCFGAAAKSPAHVCEICSRALLDPFRFCSLGCKLQGIKRGRDAFFGVEAAGSEEGGAAPVEAVTATPKMMASADTATVPHHGSSKPDVPPAPPRPPSNPRRRKGIPRRSPLAP